MRIILNIFLFFLIVFSLVSEASTLDSLQKFINNSHDTVRCRVYLVIAEELEKQDPDSANFYYKKSLILSSQNKPLLWKNNPEYGDLYAAHAIEQMAWIEAYYKAKNDESLKHSEQALTIYEKLKESKDPYIYFKTMQGISACYSNIGIVYYLQSVYPTAIEYYMKALNIAQKLSVSSDKTIATAGKKGMSSFYGNIGVAYKVSGNYVKAIESYQKALKIKEALNDQKGMCNAYNNIGNVFYEQNDFDKALNYYIKALDIAQKVNDKKRISGCLNNVGLIHTCKKNFNAALDCYFKSMKISEELGDSKGKSSCLTNIGNVYYTQKMYNLAIEYYMKSSKEDERIGDMQGAALTYNNIAGALVKIKNYKRAIEFAQKGLITAEKAGAISEQNQSYDVLKASYDSLKQFQMSLKYFKLYLSTRDSLFTIEKNKQLTEMETKYQSEKKQIEIEKLGKEKELQASEMKKQRIVILFVISGLLVVIIFSIFLFRLFIQKKKANRLLAEQKNEIEGKNEALNQQNEEIRTQRDEIEAQRDEITLQKEHIEDQKQEITDSINYAKRIQQAVMPNIGELINTKPQIPKSKIHNPLELGACLPAGQAGSFEFGSFILFKPKDIVSGDFYWATKINEWLIVTVADCTGHGVPGAFMSMLGISFLNEIVRKKEVTKASDVLDQLRTSVIDALQQKGASGEQKDGMDIALCVINTETLEMQFAGANNPCYVIARTQSVIAREELTEAISDNEKIASPAVHNDEPQLIELKPDKQPIGIHTNMQPFTNQLYQLQKGDTIYLMSDGYEDQFGGLNRKKFLAKNLKNLLIANCQLPLVEQNQILDNTITAWIGSGEQIDDITILGITI